MRDNTLRALLDTLYEEGQQNDASTQERGKKMLNLAPETAQFMSMLVQSSQRKHLLEIGTSNGYSTIWLAGAARATGGHIISIDRSEQKQQLADENLRKAGLRERVELKHGDASALVATLTGPFDFVFFDADRISAPTQLGLLVPKLAPGALVLADNVLSHPEEIAGYLRMIQVLPQFEHMVIPIGKGLSMAYYRYFL